MEWLQNQFPRTIKKIYFEFPINNWTYLQIYFCMYPACIFSSTYIRLDGCTKKNYTQIDIKIINYVKSSYHRHERERIHPILLNVVALLKIFSICSNTNNGWFTNYKNQIRFTFIYCTYIKPVIKITKIKMRCKNKQEYLWSNIWAQ